MPAFFYFPVDIFFKVIYYYDIKMISYKISKGDLCQKT